LIWNEGIVEDPFLSLKPVVFGVKMNVGGIEKGKQLFIVQLI
jgi:hypothetical protein